MGKGHKKKEMNRAARASSSSGNDQTTEEIECRDMKIVMRNLNDLSTPAKNFLTWQIHLRSHPSLKGTPLTKWSKDHSKSDTCHAHKTRISALRLTVPLRKVIGGIIGFFFDLFDRNSVPESSIRLSHISISRDDFVTVRGVLVQELTHDLKVNAIENLKTIILEVVGPVPPDLHHLITDVLEQAKASDHMKHAVLRHPSIYLECTMSSYILYLYQVVEYSLYKDYQSWITFQYIAEISIPPEYVTDWQQRIHDAGGEWPEFLDETKTSIGQKELAHFHEPIGLLCFLRHLIIHYRTNVGMKTLRTSTDVEGDIYALFPTFMPRFVCSMIQMNFFREIWID